MPSATKIITLDDLQAYHNKLKTDYIDTKVPTSRKINNTPLTADITLTASDVGAVDTADKGVAGGVATLDANGRVPSSQIPASVDEVQEYASASSFPAEGTASIIYVALDTNLCYRWGGSAYVEISPSLALGTTSSTAYRGDYGDAAYTHSTTTSGNPHNVQLSDLGYAEADSTDINGIFS